MLLAGDVGGTKTLLGLYARGTPRPAAHDVNHFRTLDFDGLTDIVDEFLQAADHPKIEAACFGVAGPVRDQVAQLTNIPWRVDAHAVATRFSIPRVWLLNDLAAMGYAVGVLAHDQLAFLQPGEPAESGNAALIAPGTGLGEALLHRIDDRWVPSPSEGGHADFAPRTPREIQLLETLTGRFGRASYEHVVSGPGLVNLHQFTHNGEACPVIPDGTPPVDQPALISTAGLEGGCARCAEALDLFVAALGAEAGNLGLRSVATAGVYLGGGIPAKILPALQRPAFLDAFRSKSPMHRLVEVMPVAVILAHDAALLGAAVAAQGLTPREN